MVEDEWEAFAVDDQDIGLLNEEMKIDLVMRYWCKVGTIEYQNPCIRK